VGHRAFFPGFIRQQAKRIGVTVGAGGRAVPAQQDDQARFGDLSMGSKFANGVGAAAPFGYCKLGCFSRSKPSSGDPGQQPLQQRPDGFQPQQ